MSITKERTKEFILKFGQSDSNTGSTEAQIAILTERIRNITKHLKENKKDYSGQRGLIKMVSLRRKLTKYLQRNTPEKYDELRSELGLRK